MKAFVAVTDKDWFDLLARSPAIDEVNFWQPSPEGGFGAIPEGAPFLFKLHRRVTGGRDLIAGGGFFAHYSRLPSSVAWESFEIKNGALSLAEMRRRIERYRRGVPARFDDYEIGCIMLAEPFFLPPDAWIDLPNWHANIVRGKTYDLSVQPGRSIWDRVKSTLRALELVNVELGAAADDRYVASVVRRRIGQGTFRGLVTDAYGRACAVTRSKALPVLQAAHIVPYAEGGEHEVSNGLLLRSDVHRLFDLGYMTVTPDYKFEVSERLRTSFHNGEEYLAMRGSDIWVPSERGMKPALEALRWHNENRFAA